MELRSVVPFRFVDPRQERVHRRLLLIGPGPAAIYKDACRLQFEGSELESKAPLVGHLLREVESALRGVLEPLPAPNDGEVFSDEVRAMRSRALDVLAKMGVPETHPVHTSVMKALQN